MTPQSHRHPHVRRSAAENESVCENGRCIRRTEEVTIVKSFDMANEELVQRNYPPSGKLKGDELGDFEEPEYRSQ